MFKHFEILMRAYSVLEDVTPLKYDCGKLCGSLCCKNNGEDGETPGMWLLPFERSFLEAIQDDMNETDKPYSFCTAEDGTETMFCKGACQRAFRPFACRIYPYYAHITRISNGRDKITVKLDPRAKLSCPIAFSDSYLRPSIFFIACVKRAIRILLTDEVIAKDLYETSDFLSEIEEMQRRFTKRH